MNRIRYANKKSTLLVRLFVSQTGITLDDLNR